MEWYDIVSLFGGVIALIGAVLLVFVVPLENSSLGLAILLLGIIVATYGLVCKVFNRVFKKGKVSVLG